MSTSRSISLSRPGMCAGRLPLHLLVQKLLRCGEHLAAGSLLDLPLPFQRGSVWWLLSGTVLTVETCHA